MKSRSHTDCPPILISAPRPLQTGTYVAIAAYAALAGNILGGTTTTLENAATTQGHTH